ncbi:MAG: hypothetical protein AB7O88_26515 [Reyranellaceae bacterium]
MIAAAIGLAFAAPVLAEKPDFAGRGRLTPAPAGYLHAQVGNDVLMLAVSTRMIVAAVRLF